MKATPMNDVGHQETEAIIKDLEKKVTKEYARAAKEMQAKLDDYFGALKSKTKNGGKW